METKKTQSADEPRKTTTHISLDLTRGSISRIHPSNSDTSIQYRLCGQHISVENGVEVLRSGKFRNILFWFADHTEAEPLSLHAFFLTYDHFVQTRRLCRLIQKEITDRLQRKLSCCGVMIFIHWWITYYFDRDFLLPDSKCNKNFNSLLALFPLLHQDKTSPNLCDRINSAKLLILRWIHVKSKKIHSRLHPNCIPPSRSIHVPTEPAFSALTNTQMMCCFEDITASMTLFEFAGQLSREELRLFKKISFSELLWLEWRNKDSGRINSQNVHKLIDRANDISGWVAMKILAGDSPEKRADIITKFIRLAGKCAQLNNYNSLMEVLGGLNMHAVQRLKESWRMLSESSVQKLLELETLMESRSNYKNYRETIRTCRFPALPYLGVYLRDLTMIEEGNSTYVDKDNLVINFEKMVLIAGILGDIKQFQHPENSYEPPFSKLGTQERNLFVKGLRAPVNVDRLDEISYSAEPLPTSRLSTGSSGPLVPLSNIGPLAPSSSCPDM